MAMFFIIIVIAFIILVTYAGISSGTRSRNAELMVKSDNFTCSKEFKSDDSKQYVAFDKDAPKVLIANISTSDTKKRLLTTFMCQSSIGKISLFTCMMKIGTNCLFLIM